MKKRNNIFLKGIMVLVTSVTLLTAAALGVCADEITDADPYTDTVAEVTDMVNESEHPNEMSAENIFEDIYTAVEGNADKIFSILAFIGTLIVGVGYKSGLIPLLNDALSKLKSAVDGVRESEEKMSRDTAEKIGDIEKALDSLQGDVSMIKGNVQSCEEICSQREMMRSIIEGQVDMLYAIFMSSSLPQYQKDEVGLRIQAMREELASYEEKTEK